MPTLAEKIDAIVREEFPCTLNCRAESGWPIEAHYLRCPAWHAPKVAAARRRAANLAIEEAATRFNAVERLLILDLALPEDKL